MTHAVTLLLGVHAHQPVGNFPEVIEDAHLRCYKPFLETLYAYPDFRFAAHFSGWLLDWLRERYPADMALLAEMVKRGQVELFMTTPASVVQHIKAGKLKALAVSSNTRLAALPQVPTAVEAGLKGFTLDSWFALYGPAGLPADVVQRLSSEVDKILASPDIKRRAEEAGTSVELMGPTQLGDYTRKELDYWGKVIKTSKISAD